MKIEITAIRIFVGPQPNPAFDIVANLDLRLADLGIEVRGATLTWTRHRGLSILPPKPVGSNRNGVRWEHDGEIARAVLAVATEAFADAGGLTPDEAAMQANAV